MDEAPLILTAQLPQDLHRALTALRRAHFPPERNFLEAHVTLFHALPPMCEGEVADWCRQMAARYAPVAGEITGVMSLGRGTAIALASAGMVALRDDLAARLHGMLTAQDQHGVRLHVTIQNKVTSRAAKALQAELAGKIAPRGFAFRGFGLHRYRGGAWESVRTFAFRGNERA